MATGQRPWPGRHIDGPDDVRRLIRQVNADGTRHGRTAALAHAVQTADETAIVEADTVRVLPAAAELEQLLPWPGIRRGATVAAIGSMSLTMTLLAGGMSQGSWAAVVGVPTFGALAASEHGIALERLALIRDPGPDWAAVVSALIDGVDLVVVATAPGVPEATTRALMARARQRGCVLIPTSPWPHSDLVIERISQNWTGIGAGHGRLKQQTVSLRAVGRGRAGRPRTATLQLPPPSITGPTNALVIPPRPPIPEPAHQAPVAPDPWSALEPNTPAFDPWADLHARRPSRLHP